MTEPGTVESHPEITSSPETSGQLILYLLGEDTLKGGPPEFPNHLNLGIFENYMRELREQTQTVRQEITPGIPALGIKPVNKKGEGEVSQTVYYDVETDSINISEAVRGNLDSTTSSLMDVVGKMKMPLLEMHTHRRESLPSNVDYQFLLLGKPGTKNRIVRAIAVLCPQYQIFALATDETPTLDPKELDQLLTNWDEDTRRLKGERGKYLKTLENRRSRVFNFIVESHKRSVEKSLERLKRDIDRANQGLEPESEPEEDNFLQVLERSLKAFTKYSRYSQKAVNRIQLEFTKEMGIKLYISTDFKNFTALPEDFSP